MKSLFLEISIAESSFVSFDYPFNKMTWRRLCMVVVPTR